jgi:surface carbohydrate biosynthesis protein
MDYQINFYRLKAHEKNPIYISIQTGRRSIESGQFFDVLRTKNYSNLSCDYIFCMGEAHAKEYSKYIKCRAIPSGMVRSNIVPLGRKDLEKKEVLFVSQYRARKNDPMVISSSVIVPWDLFYKAEKSSNF